MTIDGQSGTSFLFWVFIFCVIALIKRFWLRKYKPKKNTYKARIDRPISTTRSSSFSEHCQSIEDTKLPECVVKHIENEKNHNYPWTSALSTQDYLLLRKYKLKPVRMVMGAANFKFGWQLSYFKNFGGSGEVGDMENAMYQSAELALNRMAKEAKLLGAHAVVDIKMEKGASFSENSHDLEFVFFGTAVIIEDKPQPKMPILCTVSMPQFAKLVKMGCMPLGLALGVGVYYEYTSYAEERQRQSWINQEMSSFSQASYSARELAMKHMKNDIKRLGGDGILAYNTKMGIQKIEVSRGNNSQRTDHLLEFISFGTVIENTAQDKTTTANFKLAISMNA